MIDTNTDTNTDNDTAKTSIPIPRSAGSQIQSRRLNAVAYTLPHGVHMYAPAYTLCPVQGLAG